MAIKPEPKIPQKGFANSWKDHPLRVIGGSIATAIATVWVLMQISENRINNTSTHQITPDSHPSLTNQAVVAERTAHQTAIGQDNSGIQIGQGATNQIGSVTTIIPDPWPLTNNVTVTNYLYWITDSAGNYSVSFHIKISDEVFPAHILTPSDNFQFYSDSPSVVVQFNPSLRWSVEDKDITIDGFPYIGKVMDASYTNAYSYYFNITERGQIDLFPCDCNFNRK